MNQKNKKKLKSILSYSSFTLGLIFITLLAYALLFEVPISNEVEKKLGQTHLIDITKLKEKTLASIDEQQDLDQGLKDISTNIQEDPKKSLTKEKINDKNLENPQQISKSVKPKISILVTNLGTNKEITQNALELNKGFTLGFSAFTTSLKNYFTQAIDSKFDVFIYLPFEPKDYPISDPGPYALLKSHSFLKNLNVMKTILTEFNGCKGVYGNTREIFTSDEDSFAPIFKAINDRNLSVIIGNPSQIEHNSFIKEYKNYLNTDIIIDAIADENFIKNNLKKLELLALEKGNATGFVNTYPVTLKILSEWQKTLNDKGIELVPATKLIRLSYQNAG